MPNVCAGSTCQLSPPTCGLVLAVARLHIGPAQNRDLQGVTGTREARGLREFSPKSEEIVRRQSVGELYPAAMHAHLQSNRHMAHQPTLAMKRFKLLLMGTPTDQRPSGITVCTGRQRSVASLARGEGGGQACRPAPRAVLNSHGPRQQGRLLLATGSRECCNSTNMARQHGATAAQARLSSRANKTSPWGGNSPACTAR